MVIKKVAFGIVQGMSVFWKCEELQDFTVSLGNAQFPCHRLLLAACSDFFRGLFRSGMKETEQKFVTIRDISSETFELILEFLYTGNGILTNDNVIDVWRAAQQLQIHFLVSECQNFVIENLSLENYDEYFHACKVFSLDVEFQKVRPFLLKNCNSFFQTSYFLDLPMANVLSLIESQNLETESEDDVIHAILKWAEFQEIQPQSLGLIDKNWRNEENKLGSVGEPSRKKIKICKDISTVCSNVGNNVVTDYCDMRHNQGDVTNKENICKHLTLLLSHARTCLVSQTCLETLVIHPLVRDNKEAKDIVSDALAYRLDIGKRNGQWPSGAVQRNNSDFIHCLVEVGISENDVSFDVYSLGRKDFFYITCLEDVEMIKIVAFDNQLYALFTDSSTGNEHGNDEPMASPKKLHLLHFQYGTWSNIDISITLRSDSFSAAVVDSFIYVFSGQEQKVWKLDPNSRKITMTSYLTGHKATISYVMPYDQYIVVFYASTVQGVDDADFQCYDTSTFVWSQLHNLGGPTSGMTSFKDDHFTYLLQSNGNLWKVIKPQPNEIDFEFVIKLWSNNWPLHGSDTYTNKLYILGSIPFLEKHDPDTQRSLPGVFRRIKFIESNFDTDFYTDMMAIPVTLDRKYLT